MKYLLIDFLCMRDQKQLVINHELYLNNNRNSISHSDSYKSLVSLTNVDTLQGLSSLTGPSSPASPPPLQLLRSKSSLRMSTIGPIGEWKLVEVDHTMKKQNIFLSSDGLQRKM
jgi:hypothetical protein